METQRNVVVTAVVPHYEDVGDEHALTAREEMFCQEWARTGNKAAAYRIVYTPGERTPPGTIWSAASVISKRPHVDKRFKELQQQAALETVISIREALQHQIDIATADPNEIGYIAKRCCRHCYGQGHKYQWKNEDEYILALAQAVDANEPAPSDEGGYGYDRAQEPALDCPECIGVGVSEPVINDTTKLEGKARKLFKGLDFKSGQWVVTMHDQQKAWEMALRMLGAFNDKLDLRTPAERAGAAKIPEGATEADAARAYVEFCA